MPTLVIKDPINIVYNHTHTFLKVMLLVHSITKNLLSISKLTSDNNLYVKFVGNVCYVNDSLKDKCFCKTYWERIVQAASKVISISLFFIFMPISFYYTIINVVCMLFQFTYLKWCSKYIMFPFIPSYNASNNKIVLLHKHFDHPNNQILMHLLKTVCSINLLSNSI